MSYLDRPRDRDLRIARSILGDLGSELRAARIGAGLSQREVARAAGDLRAWDVRLDGPGSIGIDAETRLHDIQAIQRRVEAKWRDSAVDRVVLLLTASRHDRRVITEHREALVSTFPADTPEVLAALRRGRMPGSNGIVLL